VSKPKRYAPFHVTRETAGGEIGTWAVTEKTGSVFVGLLVFNVFLWGVVGILTAIYTLCELVGKVL
jgi:hypothetical protein